jgi:hypothetical protein
MKKKIHRLPNPKNEDDIKPMPIDLEYF